MLGFSSSSSSMASKTNSWKDKVKPCEICGDVGFEDFIRICSKCHISREHFYCMKNASKKVKISHEWVCEECKRGNITGSPDVSHPNAISPEARCKVSCDLRKRSPFKSQQQPVQTGKVKFLPVEEVLKLSSAPTPPKKPMVLGNVNADFNNVRVTPNPSFAGFVKPTTHGGVQSVSLANQPGTKEERTVVPGKDTEQQTVDTIKPWRLPGMKVKKRERSKRYRSVRFFSGFSGENSHAAAVPTSPDIGESDLSSIRPQLLKCLPYLPAHDATWKGDFKFSDASTENELYGGFFAQPPSRVHRKAYELSQKIPVVLQVEFLPFDCLKTEVFCNNDLELSDIGLYIFPEENIKRSKQNSTYLSELMEKRDSVIRAEIDGNELLIFSPKLLHEDSHVLSWIFDVDFFVGVFIQGCNNRTSQKMQDDDLHVETDICEDVDMEIDMEGGNTVGIVDVVVSKDLSEIVHQGDVGNSRFQVSVKQNRESMEVECSRSCLRR